MSNYIKDINTKKNIFCYCRYRNILNQKSSFINTTQGRTGPGGFIKFPCRPLSKWAEIIVVVVVSIIIVNATPPHGSLEIHVFFLRSYIQYIHINISITTLPLYIRQDIVTVTIQYVARISFIQIVPLWYLVFNIIIINT